MRKEKELLKWELGRLSKSAVLLCSCIPDLHEALSLGPVQFLAQGGRSELAIGNQSVTLYVWTINMVFIYISSPDLSP